MGEIEEFQPIHLTTVSPLSHLVFCTLSGSGSELLKKHVFSFVIVDEAAQAVEPDALVPLAYGAKKMVLIGDHRQLGPTVSSMAAARAGLTRSLFERLLPSSKNCGALAMLDTQYRMAKPICDFISEEYYDKQLKTSQSVLDRSVPPWLRLELVLKSERC